MRAPLLVAPVLLLAACSGGSGNATKAAYLKQAEAVCAQANHDVDAVPVPTSPGSLPSYVQTLVDIAGRATTQLAALDPPAKDRGTIDKKVLTPLQSQVAVGREYAGQVRSAVEHHRTLELTKLIADPPTGTKADLRWMRSYGFKECAKAADTSGR